LQVQQSDGSDVLPVSGWRRGPASAWAGSAAGPINFLRSPSRALWCGSAWRTNRVLLQPTDRYDGAGCLNPGACWQCQNISRLYDTLSENVWLHPSRSDLPPYVPPMLNTKRSIGCGWRAHTGTAMRRTLQNRVPTWVC